MVMSLVINEFANIKVFSRRLNKMELNFFDDSKNTRHRLLFIIAIFKLENSNFMFYGWRVSSVERFDIITFNF